MLIQSEKDNTISANALNNIYDNLGTSDKDSFWVKNSGHVITREPDKDLVFKRINSFINKTNGN